MRRNPHWDAIMEVVLWLRSLGLEEYEAAFRENEIDERVLPSLTVEDLKALGVAALDRCVVGAARLALPAARGCGFDMSASDFFDRRNECKLSTPL